MGALIHTSAGATFRKATGVVREFLALTLAIVAFLASLGIILTEGQMIELDDLLRGLPSPAPMAAAPKARKAKTKFAVKDIPSEALDLIRSMGHKI